MRFYRLEVQHAHWLEQNCRCESEEECECLTLNEWINELMESMFDGVSSEEEFYA